MVELLDTPRLPAQQIGHRRWVRVLHWVLTLSIFTLAFTGVVILMAHPRLYWGEVGNDLTTALFELPISRNHRHGGWAASAPMFQDAAAPISANRTYDIFNQNGWGRSLHFLAAWFVVVPGAIYLIAGVASGHFRRHFLPRRAELERRALADELFDHLRLRGSRATGGPDYSLLQKTAYCGVVFVALPLAILSGLAMSPAVSAAYPVLTRMFDGFQSARTIHFFTFVALGLFVVVHVLMVIRSGFRRQMRGMTVGR
jgi:thiosulfate reductase cytochrome b subunit